MIISETNCKYPNSTINGKKIIKLKLNTISLGMIKEVIDKYCYIILEASFSCPVYAITEGDSIEVFLGDAKVNRYGDISFLGSKIGYDFEITRPNHVMIKVNEIKVIK